MTLPTKARKAVKELCTIKAAADCVPTTWLDPLLSGPKGIGTGPWGERNVEKLLRGIQDRIRALTPVLPTKRRKKS